MDLDLSRLLAPKSVAVIGGGAWCESVVRGAQFSHQDIEVWPVHPSKETIGGQKAYTSLGDLPGVPDAAFVGVNRTISVEIVRDLAAMGCGGAVCFAAGYSEAASELADGDKMQAALLSAADTMPVLGPNCYGFVNALDGVALWPDMHGLDPCDTGVAIIGQSSNVLINLTMQQRGLDIAAVVAVGNQAQLSMAEIGMALLNDPRITALGLHIEGITNLAAFEALARHAASLQKPIVALKVGASEQAQAAAVSHTAALVGSDIGARALFSRLGIGQVATPAELIEALKLLHITGGLSSAEIASASCSGGEASLMADIGAQYGVTFPRLSDEQTEGLRAVLGPKVALANPLDYNTYIWGDEDALTACFTALASRDLGLLAIVLDFPRSDRFDAPEWQMVVRAAAAANTACEAPIALISLLPDGLPEVVSKSAVEQGLVPLCGLVNAVAAIRAAADCGGQALERLPLLIPKGIALEDGRTIGEVDAKTHLAKAGLVVPKSREVEGVAAAAMAAQNIGFPVVLKGTGVAHKTDAGLVRLNLCSPEDVAAAAEEMGSVRFLVEEMITGTVVELLLGVTRDPVHGFVLTLGLGGIWTELMGDTVSLLIPSSREDVRTALMSLRAAPVLCGYRGREAANIEAVIDSAMSLQTFVTAHADSLHEAEINPLICRVNDAIAADALIKTGGDDA